LLRRSQAGCFRRSATVFKISRESASSDTARASDIAPTSALKVKIALDLGALIPAWQQPDNQLKVIPDLFGGKGTGPLIAASEFRRQRAERTAGTWILAVHIDRHARPDTTANEYGERARDGRIGVRDADERRGKNVI
jgi:hypothetical protein